MLEPGSELAGHRIIKVLGEGGMGIVYEATQPTTERHVALKVIGPPLSKDPDFRERFVRECRALAKLRHPNIVDVYSAFETDQELAFSMYLVDGPTLRDILDEGPIEHHTALTVFKSIASALKAAHRKGLIHRDIKPENVMIDSDGQALLGDFGITRAVGDKRLTGSGGWIGTPDYMSPEQIEGRDVTEQSDVYSLAAVIYECLTGVVPFPKDSHLATFVAHAHDEPPRASEQNPELPEALDEVLTRGLAKKPEDRQDSPAQLASEVSEALGVGGLRQRSTRAMRGMLREGDPASSSASPARDADPAVTPVRKTMSQSRRWALLGLASLIAGATAFLLGTLVFGEDTPSLSRTAAAGPISLNYPGDWEPTNNQPSVPGIEFEQPTALAPAKNQSGDGLVAGMTDASGPTLLPAGFEERLSSPASPNDAVQLGEAQALRYRDLAVRGAEQPITLYAVPTDSGVATIACVGDGTRVSADCDGIAGSLDLNGPSAFPLGPDNAYATVLNRVLSDLNDERRQGRNEIGSASDDAEQAAAANGIAAAYRNSGRELEQTSVSPESQSAATAITDAISEARDAYSALAEAAGSGDTTAFSAAKQSVAEAEDRLRDALEALRDLGYTVP